MAVEAPYSKYRRQNCWIIITLCLALAVWCAYDGYFNKQWIEEHTNPDGSPQTYLTVNRNAPPYLIGVAVIAFIFWLVIRGKKVIAEDDALIVAGKEKIPYSAIKKIDKTYFDSKGFFAITYDNQGRQANRKISSYSYDNLKAVLDYLIEKVS